MSVCIYVLIVLKIFLRVTSALTAKGSFISIKPKLMKVRHQPYWTKTLMTLHYQILNPQNNFRFVN